MMVGEVDEPAVILGWFSLGLFRDRGAGPGGILPMPQSAPVGSGHGSPNGTPEYVPVIEQAKGIVMAQHRCGPDEAFDLLRRMSQHANVKVRVLATRMVEQISSPNTR